MLGQFFEMLKHKDWLKQKINCFEPKRQLFSHLGNDMMPTVF